MQENKAWDKSMFLITVIEVKENWRKYFNMFDEEK